MAAIPGPRIDHLHEMARFYDYWLRGVENGVMDEPPIALYVQQFDPPEAERKQTSGFWRHEPGWPLDRSHEQHALPLATARSRPMRQPKRRRYHYDYNPTVGTTFGMFSAGSPLVLPIDQRLEEAYSTNWTSVPLDEELEILAAPRFSSKCRPPPRSPPWPRG